MSERKKGSRLNGRAIECFVCNKMGNHKQLLTNKGFKFICPACKKLAIEAGL